jgi:hypothetical protein
VNRDRDRFNQRRVLKRHFVWQRINYALGHNNVFCKCSHSPEFGCRNTDNLPIVAEIHLAPVAIKAIPAIDGRVKRDSVARPETGHRATNRLYDTGCLMAHNDRWQPSTCAPVVAMHITSANAARVYANEQILCSDFWLVHIDQIELLVFSQNESFQ